MEPYKLTIPRPSMSLRSRREVNAQDQINSLRVEQWQTDAPALQNDRSDPRSQRAFMDMNPINTRTVSRNYLQNQPYVAGMTGGGGLGGNPYFDKFDVTTDPFNVAREVRAAVYEERTDRGVEESKRLLNRVYTTRWLPEDYVEKHSLDTLKAYESLMPQMNKMETVYRKYEPSQNGVQSP